MAIMIRHTWVIALALIVVAAPASAAETVDLSGVVELAIDYGIVIVVALVGFAWNKTLARPLAKYLGERTEASAREALFEIARRGIQLSFEERGLTKRAQAVVIKSEIIRDAAAYVASSAPGYVADFGLSPDRIEDMVRARLLDEVEALPNLYPSDHGKG
ncbi:MAG: hypothetical protein AAFR17_12405 [Pseudomonadota bacterium]